VNATIAPTHVVQTRRVRRARAAQSAAAALPAAPNAPTAQLARTLPMRAGVAVGVSAPNWMWILGGAVLGTFLLGPIGTVGGALAGYLLTK
jgi:hypothetical protein